MAPTAGLARTVERNVARGPLAAPAVVVHPAKHRCQRVDLVTGPSATEGVQPATRWVPDLHPSISPLKDGVLGVAGCGLGWWSQVISLMATVRGRVTTYVIASAMSCAAMVWPIWPLRLSSTSALL